MQHFIMTKTLELSKDHKGPLIFQMNRENFDSLCSTVIDKSEPSCTYPLAPNNQHTVTPSDDVAPHQVRVLHAGEVVAVLEIPSGAKKEA